MAIKKPQINQFSSYFEIITIDLSKFNIDYDVEFDNVQPIQANIKTLYKFMNYDFDELEDFYEDYTLDDFDRPDLLAKRLYGDENLWWLILTINNISYYELPLTDENLYEMATYLFNNEYKYSLSTYYDLLKEENELKRAIRILKPQYTYLILRQIYDKLKRK